MLTVWQKTKPYIPYFLMAAILVIAAIDPVLANIFAKPTQKLQALKTGLLMLAKIAVAIAFVGCFLAALAGLINWRWVAVVAGVAIALATLDTILGFLEIG